MRKHSICWLKKGYTVIYVMLISTLILAMVLVLYKLEFNKYKYLQLRKKSMEAINTYYYKKEKVFSIFYNSLQSGNVVMNRQDIINFVKTHEFAANIAFEDMTMKFYSDTELFLITFPNNSLYNWNEYYELKMIEGKMKMSIAYRELKARNNYAEKKYNFGT